VQGECVHGLSKRRCRRPRSPPCARLASPPGHDGAGSEEATPSTVVYHTCQLSLCQPGPSTCAVVLPLPPLSPSHWPVTITQQASERVHERGMTPMQVHYYLYRREYLPTPLPRVQCKRQRTQRQREEKEKKKTPRVPSLSHVHVALDNQTSPEPRHQR